MIDMRLKQHSWLPITFPTNQCFFKVSKDFLCSSISFKYANVDRSLKRHVLGHPEKTGLDRGWRWKQTQGPGHLVGHIGGGPNILLKCSLTSQPWPQVLPRMSATEQNSYLFSIDLTNIYAVFIMVIYVALS